MMNPDSTDMQFPDRSSKKNVKKRLDKIEIDFDDFLVQGIQRNWSRELKKQEKKEHRRRAQERARGPEDHLKNENNPEVDEEAGINK